MGEPLARALARERGLDIHDVVPGPDGAVRAAQVTNAGHAIRQVAPPGTGTSVAGSVHLLVADADVTGLERALASGSADPAAREGAEPSLFAAVTQLVVQSLRRCPGVHADDVSVPVHLSVLREDDMWSEVPDAGSLSFAGLLRALGTRTPAPTPDAGLVVIDSDSTGIALELMSPPAGARAALTVGGVQRSVSVVTTDGAEGIAVRSVIRLGLSLDASCVGRADAAAFLRDLVSRLAGTTASELGFPVAATA
ncbi:MAG: hypothetical protein L0I76_00890 [Pseudonocardia sp.]|nr:hypothetical protein [Pseudonocardia sp.]